MRNYSAALIVLLVGCSNATDNGTASNQICPPALLEKRASDAAEADIVISGKWTFAEPDVTPGISIRIGSIEPTKSIRGSLVKEDMVGILTSHLTDASGKITECGLSDPPDNENRTFYIQRHARSFQVIDHKPTAEN